MQFEARSTTELPPASTSVVRLVDVWRHYPHAGQDVQVLRGVSFTVERGSLVAMVGPSGCGKSTTLNLLSGVDRPDSGQVWVDGTELTTATESTLVALRRRTVGVVFQAFHLMPNLSVEENIALPLALSGRRDLRRVHELVERVGLEGRRHHVPAELSGGEQQRTAVARALVHRPVVLLADEPTGNLDSANGHAVLMLIDQLRREEGTAVVLATHDVRIAATADAVIAMRDGVVVTDP